MNLNVNPFQISHIIENIFHYLPFRDLSSSACVSKLWNIISFEEQKRRKRIVWFFQGVKCKQHNEMHLCSENCAVENISHFETELYEQLRNLRMKPAFCIAFVTSGFLKMFEQLFPSHLKRNKPPRKKMKLKEDDEYRHKYLDSVIDTVLGNKLPSSCKIGCYVGMGITATKQDMSRLEIKEAPAIAGYLFPDFPDGEIKLCKRDLHKYDLLKIIGKDRKIKSMLALAEHKSMIYLSVALYELRNMVTISETGCAYLVQRENGYIPVFSGPNVQTYCLSEETFKWKDFLKAEHSLFKNQNIAFLFTTHNESQVNIISEIFPNTPIIGLFGTSKIEGFDEREIKYVESCVPSCLTEKQLSSCVKCIIVSFKALPLV